MRCAKQYCPHLENQRDYSADPVTGLCSGCLHAHILHYLENLSITHITEDVCEEFACAGIDALDDVISAEVRHAKKSVRA